MEEKITLESLDKRMMNLQFSTWMFFAVTALLLILIIHSVRK